MGLLPHAGTGLLPETGTEAIQIGLWLSQENHLGDFRSEQACGTHSSLDPHLLIHPLALSLFHKGKQTILDD